jgi:hypothetical protein
MSNFADGASLSKSVLGRIVSKAYTPLVVETKTLFTVSGLVLVTAIVGKVTTAITVANTIKLQANPTTGTTQDLCAATDLGTTDTPAGDLITIAGAAASAPVVGIGAVPVFATAHGIAVAAGTIEQVTATGADGGITWFLSYVEIESGATVVAA